MQGRAWTECIQYKEEMEGSGTSITESLTPFGTIRPLTKMSKEFGF